MPCLGLTFRTNFRIANRGIICEFASNYTPSSSLNHEFHLHLNCFAGRGSICSPWNENERKVSLYPYSTISAPQTFSRPLFPQLFLVRGIRIFVMRGLGFGGGLRMRWTRHIGFRLRVVFRLCGSWCRSTPRRGFRCIISVTFGPLVATAMTVWGFRRRWGILLARFSVPLVWSSSTTLVSFSQRWPWSFTGLLFEATVKQLRRSLVFGIFACPLIFNVIRTISSVLFW